MVKLFFFMCASVTLGALGITNSKLYPTLPKMVVGAHKVLSHVNELTDIALKFEQLSGDPTQVSRDATKIQWTVLQINSVLEHIMRLFHEFDGRNSTKAELAIKVINDVENLLLLLKRYCRQFVT